MGIKEYLVEVTGHPSQQNPDVLWTGADQRRLQVHQQRRLVFGVAVWDGWKCDSSENNQRTQTHEKWTQYPDRQSGTGRHRTRRDRDPHQCL